MTRRPPNRTLQIELSNGQKGFTLNPFQLRVLEMVADSGPSGLPARALSPCERAALRALEGLGIVIEEIDDDRGQRLVLRTPIKILPEGRP